MPTIINNAAPGRDSRGTGSGVAQQRTPFGHMSISGEAGEVVRIPAAALFPIFGQVLQGAWAQTGAGGGSVQVDVTFVSPDLAMNPKQDTVNSHWVADTTFAAGDFKPLTHKLFTALRITFTGKNIIHIGGA